MYPMSGREVAGVLEQTSSSRSAAASIDGCERALESAFDVIRSQQPGIPCGFEIHGRGRTRRRSYAPLRADRRDIDGFRAMAYDCEMSRQHMFAFENDHDPEELARRVRLAFRDEMDTDFLVGVHTDTETNHVHIAQVGTADECYMDSDDIEQLRSAVVNRFDDETIGARGTA